MSIRADAGLAAASQGFSYLVALASRYLPVISPKGSDARPWVGVTGNKQYQFPSKIQPGLTRLTISESGAWCKKAVACVRQRGRPQYTVYCGSDYGRTTGPRILFPTVGIAAGSSHLK